MTFFEKVQHYLEPISRDKMIYGKSFFEGIMDGTFYISSLYFFEKIGGSITHGDERGFYNYLIIYSIYVLLYSIFKIYAIHW